jgi:hypothetical protein
MSIRLQRLSWPLWVVGTLLIAGSWFDIVSSEQGCLGFGIALLGSLLSWLPRRSALDNLSPGTRQYVEEHLNDLRRDATAVTPSSEVKEAGTGAKESKP